MLHNMKALGPTCLFIIFQWLCPLTPARAQPQIGTFSANVVDQQVSYTVDVCDPSTNSSTLFIYRDLSSSPTLSTPADDQQFVGSPPPTCGGGGRTSVWAGAPLGLYQSYARFGSAAALGAVAGPIDVCVGPDLVLQNFDVTSDGALITYNVRICNNGSMTAQKFRVGFWPNLSAAPNSGDFGTIFEAVKKLDPATCDDLDVPGGVQENGDFQAWARIDSADFVDECREGNNTAGPIGFMLRNPDLVVDAFGASVNGRTVIYSARVCNVGAADVSKFFVDLYYDRPTAAPTVGIPGDDVQPVLSLAQSQCTDLQFTRSNAPDGQYRSYVLIDSDEFISEPDEGNNFGDPITVRVGQGTNQTPIEVCVDADQDGFGIGPTCEGPQDCDDSNPAIRPGAEEVCGDDIDQDCDFTADDGCPGVDCRDDDGDGWGVGSACVVPDCDDRNPQLFPYADGAPVECRSTCVDNDGDGWSVGPGCEGQPDCDDTNAARHPGLDEHCGDEVDNDCDLTVDDGCPGVACTDGDGDGFGVGDACVVSDPDDTNPQITPWRVCADADKDGFVAGPDCRGVVPDCDDRDPAINPGVSEDCTDTLDNDCDLTPNDTCPGVDCVDRDGDSFGVGADCVLVDCDDTNKDIHPWALEICGDGIDDNCNKIVDDGCRGRACVDRDADGYGVGAGCPSEEDCDDNDFFSNPGAKEQCGDGLDQDCDRVADDGCDTEVDADGDGFSVGGAVKGPVDCNDEDSQINPSAKEICGDGIDNNCNLTVDDGCPNVACTDSDGDGWGIGPDCIVADCADDDPQRHPFAEEKCGDGIDNDCDETVDDGCAGVDCVDSDLDRWGIGPDCAKVDCDDTDGGISPWSIERCGDRVDNNCNGAVDENCAACRDEDGDGAGIGPKCALWDCNDADPTVFPKAEEICDLKDNDCNESIPASEFECEETGESGCSCSEGDPGELTFGLIVLLLMLGGRRLRGGVSS